VTGDGRAEQLDRFATGFDEVAAALDGASDEELDRHGPAGWSARMVVHHLADSETTAYVRLRRLIGEDDPLLQDYDEEAFARRLHYDRPIEGDLALLGAVRASSLELLHTLTPDEWQRSGTHTVAGPYSVEGWLRTYADHSPDHADQIRRARRGED
jgi:hypothetical protein